MATAPPIARDEWREGWPAALAATLAMGATTVHFYTIGVFIKPIHQALGWSVSDITIGIFICALIAVPGSPFIGWLASRIGVRRIAMVGLPCFFLAFASCGLVSTTMNGWLLAWSAVALTSVMLKSNLWMMVIARRFDAARGTAFAVVASGGGIFAVFSPVLTQFLIDQVGWRMAFFALSAIMGAISIPIILLGLGPDVPQKRDAPSMRGNPIFAGASGDRLRIIIRQPQFWLLMLLGFLLGGSSVALQVHLVPILEQKGLGTHLVVILAGAFGAAAMVGRLVAGVLLDRVPARLVGIVSLCLPAVACLLYFRPDFGVRSGIILAVLFGANVGAETDVLAYLTSRYFRASSFGMIFGFISGVTALGSGTGPMLIALVRDRTGSYDLVLQIILGSFALSAIAIAALGPRAEAAADLTAYDPAITDANSTEALRTATL